ncbi:MAG: T9SS type A sorting domain-containing protein [Saprospiraceae bacterium]|nr:T9SS type A sorting domain-containing protein [Saprospiraceae bacterium]
MKLSLRPVALAAALTLCALPALFSQNLSLNPAFADGGLFAEPGACTGYPGLFPLAGGNWLLVSQAVYNTKTLHRLRPDGSLDPDFGQNGTVELKDLFGLQQIVDLAECANGKLLVLGYTAWGSGSCSDPLDLYLKIFRLNADGSPDLDFAQQGHQEWYFSHPAWLAPFSRLANGHLLTLLYEGSEYLYRCEVLEFDADGLLLPGAVSLKMPRSAKISKVNALSRTADGQYLALLTHGAQTYLGQFNANGTADTPFGDQGLLALPSATRLGKVHAFGPGRIILQVWSADYQQQFLVALHPETGMIDYTFCPAGFFPLEFNTAQNGSCFRQAMLHADDSWTTMQATGGVTEILRLTAGLQPDRSFTPTGRGYLPAGLVLQSFSDRAMAYAGNRNILVAGKFKTATGTGYALASLQSEAPLPPRIDPAPAAAAGVKAPASPEIPENAPRPVRFRLWPNPAGALLHIEGPAPVAGLELYSAAGVWLGNLPDVQELDLSGLAAGSYFLKIYGEGQTAPEVLPFVKR